MENPNNRNISDYECIEKTAAIHDSGIYINNSEKKAYFERLTTPYEKKGVCKYFIDQYVRGSGNELYDKFWNIKSSSRLAFDLYSWMAKDISVLDFEFEKHLPSPASGGTGPNMDVYIETEDEIIFVESKFTERANCNYINNSYLSPAYYAPVHGKKQMSLMERFRGYSFAEDFSGFCRSFEDSMVANNWHQAKDWFEPKQETCHLFGILSYLFNPENKERVNDKTIKLINIYWKMMDDKDNSEMKQEFERKVKRLVENIHIPNGIRKFEFSTFSVQKLLDDNSLLSPHIIFPDYLKEEIYSRNNRIISNPNRW